VNTYRSVVRFAPDGSADQTFQPPTMNLGGFIQSLALQPDGKILILGHFPSVNAVPRDGIARLNQDGSLDESFDPPFLGEPLLHTVAFDPHGRLLIGGSLFRSRNGLTGNSVARLNPNGSLDDSFKDPRVAGYFPTATSVVVQEDGKILIGGTFTSVGGRSRRGIARLNPDGSPDASFNPGSGVSGPSGSEPAWEFIHFALQPAGKILVAGGRFDTFNGVPRRNIVRLNPDGSVDMTFVPGNAPGMAYGMILQPDGKVLLAGPPHRYSNEPALFPMMVRLHGSDLLPPLRIARADGVVVLSWPAASAEGAFLESATSLLPDAAWKIETTSPTILGDNVLVTIETSETTPAAYFRLRKN
jgi:uncharacterized delta-60 repeat protein